MGALVERAGHAPACDGVSEGLLANATRPAVQTRRPADQHVARAQARRDLHGERDRAGGDGAPRVHHSGAFVSYGSFEPCGAEAVDQVSRSTGRAEGLMVAFRAQHTLEHLCGGNWGSPGSRGLP